MTKKITLNESKLARFSAVAGAVLAGGAVNAQITYVDVNPDVVVDVVNTDYQFDFNADAAPDLAFGVSAFTGSGTSQNSASTVTYTYNYAGSGAGVGAATNGGVIGTSTNSNFYPTAMNQNDVIGVAGSFGAGGTLAGYVSVTFPLSSSYNGTADWGNWVGANDKYLGAKFTALDGVHYGWVRLSVAADASTITIKDYAYNTVVDGQILAGQTSNIENVAVDNKVSIKTTLNNATVNVTPDLVGGNIVLVDMAGREVNSVIISDLNTTVSFEGLETGIYTIAAKFEAGTVNKRVYVK